MYVSLEKEKKAFGNGLGLYFPAFPAEINVPSSPLGETTLR